MRYSCHLRNNPAQDPINTGHVNYISPIMGGRGKMYIKMRYDLDRHFNILDMFLEYTPRQANSPVFLKGGFSTHSALTHKPLAAPIIFEQIGDDAIAQVATIPIIKQDGSVSDELIAFHKRNERLLDFFINDQVSQYSSHASVFQALQRLKESGRSPAVFSTRPFRVFVSVPLLQHNSSEEYNRNTRLVEELIQVLVEKFGIEKESIYTAIHDYDSGQVRTFDEYSSETRKPLVTYKRIKKILENASQMIFMYPTPPKQNGKKNQPRRISASFIELGYSLGLDKKLIILCDKTEFDLLPQNLIQLNQSRIIIFNSSADKPIHSMLARTENRDMFTKALSLSGQKFDL